jgi:hypothetical protein
LLNSADGIARAAARSSAILSGLVVFAFCLEFVRRADRWFSSTLAILTGIEAGIVPGYLVATRNRSSATWHRDSRRDYHRV